jgi:hypothetical protein
MSVLVRFVRHADSEVATPDARHPTDCYSSVVAEHRGPGACGAPPASEPAKRLTVDAVPATVSA